MKCFSQINVRLKKPIWSKIEGKFINSVLVPCGKCAACVERKIMEWSFRLTEEMKDANNCYFITLTYDNKHIPLNQYGKMNLDKKHLQSFFKLLKQDKKRKQAYGEYGVWEQFYYKSNLDKPIKYYAVGEYGSVTKRSHYHAIVFNVSREAITRLWKYGYVDIQVPRGKNAMSYVAKYMYKRIFKVTPKNVSPEFAIMSKGLGEAYVHKMKSFYKQNKHILFTSMSNGIDVPMSKFYRKKFWSEEEREEQIPIIKINIDMNFNEQLNQWGEEGYYRMKCNVEKQYTIKIKRKFKPRKDT